MSKLFVVPELEPTDLEVAETEGGGTDPDFDELVFLAEKIALHVLANLKWEAMHYVAAGVVTDPEDANVIVRLLKNADYSVEITGDAS